MTLLENLYNLPHSPEDLLSQIIEAYPENDFQSLRKVISIGTVKYQNEIAPGVPMTAAVINTKPYTLVFGKSFMEKNMKSIEDCVYLLAHELTHLVLDHFAKDILSEFKEKKLGIKAVHIVVDCQVNATCYNSLLDDKYFEFVKRYYPKNEMPYCFFRADGEPPTEQLKVLHKKLFSMEGITNKELIDGLMEWFNEQQDQLDEIIQKCLGNHKDMMKDKSGENNNEELDDLVEAIGSDLEDILERKKEQKEDAETKSEKNNESITSGGKEASCGGSPRERLIQTSLDKIRYAKNIKRQLNRSEVVSPSSRIYKAISSFFPKRQARTVVPNFYDRRTAALFSQGKLPIFHMNKEIGSRVIVPCYLDVSGSQDHVIPYMLPVVSRLKKQIGNIVYCFSTYIAETHIGKLERGKIQSSGGTDFNPIVDHILKNKFKNAVILTDGEAYLSEDNIIKLKNKRVKITVGWTVPSPRLEPLSKVAEKVFFVFGEGHGRP